MVVRGERELGVIGGREWGVRGEGESGEREWV